MADEIILQDEDPNDALDVSAAAAEDTQQSHIKREPDQAKLEAEKRLVSDWQSRVRAAKKHWSADFKRIREDQNFTYGLQWPDQKRLNGETEDEDRYVANITLRHVQQRVSALYAKNPKPVARRREQLFATVWDGSHQSLQLAQAQAGMIQQVLPQAMMAMQAGDMQGLAGALQTGMGLLPQLQQAQAVLQDAENVRQQTAMLDKVAKTLELLQLYTIQEQVHNFKVMMKLVVRRAITTGVGYVKIGYQRVMERRPDVEAQIADIAEQLSVVQRRAADLADGEIHEDNPDVAALREQMRVLSENIETVVREGIVFDYPNSTSIIPDPKTTHLKEFLGADWVAQEYVLTPDEIKEIYAVDVSQQYTAYRKDRLTDVSDEVVAEMERRAGLTGDGDDADANTGCAALVWEIYSRKDGLVFHVCDGYPDFLKPPAAPDVYIERFWPWFPLVFNECDHESRIFPPSDVRLIRDMQNEMNRARQGLREHRIASRPKTVAAAGVLSDTDKTKLENHPNNAVIELEGLTPGQKVEDLLQPFNGPQINPNLYETGSIYEDMLRTTGNQEANLGGTAGATATETQIAESSRMTSLGSNIDDLDDLLTALFRACGQVHLLETSEDTVKKIVGPGAVWPQMTKADVAQEIYLEVEAGSTGRPSKTQDIQNAERIVPLLMQVPGVSPEFLARELLRRLDDRIDLTQAFSQGVPSIMAMNAMQGIAMRGVTGANPPGAQGPRGASNAPKPPEAGGAPGGPDVTSTPVSQTV